MKPAIAFLILCSLVSAQDIVIESPHAMVVTSPMEVRMVKAGAYAYYMDGATKIVPSSDGCSIAAKPGTYTLRVVSFVVQDGAVKQVKYAQREVRFSETLGGAGGTRGFSPAQTSLPRQALAPPAKEPAPTRDLEGVTIEMTVSGNPNVVCETCQRWRANELEWYRSRGAVVKFPPVLNQAVPSFTIRYRGRTAKYFSAEDACLSRETFAQLFKGLSS